MEKETPRTTKRRDIASKRQKYFQQQEQVRQIPPHSPDSLQNNPTRESIEVEQEHADELNTSRTYTIESISDREQREREAFESSLNDRMSRLRSCTPVDNLPADSKAEEPASSDSDDLVLLTHRPEENVGLNRVELKPAIPEDPVDDCADSPRSFANVNDVDELVQEELTNSTPQSPEIVESSLAAQNEVEEEKRDDSTIADEENGAADESQQLSDHSKENSEVIDEIEERSTKCSTPTPKTASRSSESVDQLHQPQVTSSPAPDGSLRAQDDKKNDVDEQISRENIIIEHKSEPTEAIFEEEEEEEETIDKTDDNVLKSSRSSVLLDEDPPVAVSMPAAEALVAPRLMSGSNRDQSEAQDSPRSFATVDDVEDLFNKKEVTEEPAENNTPRASVSSARDSPKATQINGEVQSDVLSSRPISQASIKNYRELVSAREQTENSLAPVQQPQSLSFLSPTSSISLNIENNSDDTIQKSSSSSSSSSKSSQKSSNLSSVKSGSYHLSNPENEAGEELSERAETLSLRDLAPNSPIMFTMPSKTHPEDEMDENLRAILEKSNSILKQSHLLVNEAQVKLTEEFKKEMPRGPKQVPVLYGKRKESDLLESHRGNFSRHWERAAPLSWEHEETKLRRPRYKGKVKPNYIFDI